jgi:membrane protein implicated in regulation of membrane protease activity
VVERVSNPEAAGCVRIDDELWSARTPTDEDGPIENGERVHVVEVRGSTAIVSR